VHPVDKNFSSAPFQPCIPTRGKQVPHHDDWLHEVKHDGFRLIVQRDGDRVRLFTRNCYNWTSRYPLIVEAARRIRTKQFVLDGEAVFLGVDGISDFDALYGGKN
jgi:bifunctional non-homologous end joining protein LigD